MDFNCNYIIVFNLEFIEGFVYMKNVIKIKLEIIIGL